MIRLNITTFTRNKLIQITLDNSIIDVIDITDAVLVQATVFYRAVAAAQFHRRASKDMQAQRMRRCSV